MAHMLSRRITDVLNLQPDAQAIEYRGHWLSWARSAAWRPRSVSW
ncbi:hypothetical protein I553_3207 [Mycobacterium xenopi 4042]|uniref:Uncharacterized protein n=1 Tax=Mycobacterium xenopi 4042 TaxID=1299334 RepID=X8E680_MYCXE|nr:hypothetical protein I552_0890 [Mycobacterium xenopi 3993]EUA75315.1 hypothetical protein I553_3207 [Mycobacterium xenopi 4042]